MPFADTSSRFSLHLEYNTIQITLKTFTVLCHWVLMMSLITFFQALIYTSRLVLLACVFITGPSYSFTVGMVAVPESTTVLATDCGSAITAPGLRPRPHETSASHQDHLYLCIQIQFLTNSLSFYFTTKVSGVRYWGESMPAPRLRSNQLTFLFSWQPSKRESLPPSHTKKPCQTQTPSLLFLCFLDFIWTPWLLPFNQLCLQRFI